MSVEPVEVVTSAAGSAEAGGPLAALGGAETVLWAATGVMTAALASVVALRHAGVLGGGRFGTAAMPPEEAAFRMMARRLRLGRKRRGRLRTLAGVVEVKPVALLVCESAFARAVEAAEADESLGRAESLDLRHRIFGEGK